MADNPIPPAHMPAFRGARPLKRWRYVGVFCEDFSLCAAWVRVGPAAQTFWAVLERSGGPAGGRSAGRLFERTRLVPRRGALTLAPGRLRIRDGDVRAELTLAEGEGVQTVCPNGSAYVWTRKQAGVRAHGTLGIAGEPPPPIEALAVIDDTAGYHARVTEWRWAAGVGAGPDGTALAFNLVEGVNDPPAGSERAIWVAGVAHEAPPVHFGDDLRSIVARDGSRLDFAPEAERVRHDNLLIVRSAYRASFGTFSGVLPGQIPLTHAVGVVEHHRARW